MSNVPWYFALLILTTAHLLIGVLGEDPLLGTIYIRFYGTSLESYDDEFLNEALLLGEKLDNNKTTVLYIHGFSESVDSTSVITVVNAYIHRGDHNILAVDYRNISSLPYTQAVEYVFGVGAEIALALGKIVEAGISSEKLHIVGHSLGAQVASQVGKFCTFQLPRITGLDPAGPLFNNILPHLSYLDARFVDIIHTDFGFYGTDIVSGTVDFFPNNGHRIQPGCPLLYVPFSNEDFCSHHRSWKYYAESVMTDDSFIAVKCSSFLQFISGLCKNNQKIPMGYGTPTNALVYT